jgi:protein ImuA
MVQSLLSELRERIGRIERPAATHGVLPFGVAAIDRALPGGGLVRGQSVGSGLVLWCSAHRDLYGPGLAAHGLDPGRLVLVRAPCDAEILWAMEEGLRCSCIAAVVGEVGSLPAIASRRLQLAAERSGITAFLLRRWRNGGQAARERALPNAAATRWRVAALPSWCPRGETGVGLPRWQVELLRCRGGEPASWEIEVPNATDPIPLVATLADRPAAPVAASKLCRTG